MSGDVYSIDARGETVVIAYFDDWGDSFILKSTDNGDTTKITRAENHKTNADIVQILKAFLKAVLY